LCPEEGLLDEIIDVKNGLALLSALLVLLLIECCLDEIILSLFVSNITDNILVAQYDSHECFSSY
jgi:hypothetical protein